MHKESKDIHYKTQTGSSCEKCNSKAISQMQLKG